MKIGKLVKIDEMMIPKHTLRVRPEVQNWCRIPYYKKRKGCPNYGKNPLCPPLIGFDPDLLEHYEEFLLVWAEFDFKTYREGMKKIHENWTDRQCRNVLYWQGQLKAIMRRHISPLRLLYKKLLGAGSGFWDAPSMEAVGIDVFYCLRKNGIDFQIHPNDKVVMVALLMR